MSRDSYRLFCFVGWGMGGGGGGGGGSQEGVRYLPSLPFSPAV